MSDEIDVESTWDSVIADAGGCRVDQIVGTSPPFENADYIVPAHRTLVELKCLDIDKMRESPTVEKASQLYAQELSAGRSPVIVFGTVEMTTEGFSAEFARNLMSIYRSSIQQVLKKANDQIKATKKALDLPDYQGLVIIANNSHSALAPSHAHSRLTNLLEPESRLRSLNGAVYLSANQRVVDPAVRREIAIWLRFPRPTLPAPDQALLDRLRRGWISRLADFRGVAPPTAHDLSHADLWTLENMKR